MTQQDAEEFLSAAIIILTIVTILLLLIIISSVLAARWLPFGLVRGGGVLASFTAVAPPQPFHSRMHGLVRSSVPIASFTMVMSLWLSGGLVRNGTRGCKGWIS